jgi:hypothetical protein
MEGEAMNAMFLPLTLRAPVGIDAAPVAAATAPLVCGVWGEVWAPGPCCESRPRLFAGLMGMLRRRGSSDCGCGGPAGAPPVESVAPPGPAGTLPPMPSAAGLPDASYRPLPAGATTPVLQEEVPVIIQGN